MTSVILQICNLLVESVTHGNKGLLQNDKCAIFSIVVGLNCVNPPPCLFKMVDRQFPKFEEGNGWGQFKLVQYAGDPKKVVVK